MISLADRLLLSIREQDSEDKGYVVLTKGRKGATSYVGEEEDFSSLKDLVDTLGIDEGDLDPLWWDTGADSVDKYPDAAIEATIEVGLIDGKVLYKVLMEGWTKGDSAWVEASDFYEM